MLKIHILAIVIVAIWGTTYVVTKVLLAAGLMPADVFFYRFLLAYMLSWPLCYKKLFADSLRDEFLLFLAGATGGSLYFLAENTALMMTPASDVAILVSACPIWTSIIMMKWERMTRLQMFGILIAFIGVALVIFNGHIIFHVSTLGYTLALASGFIWALYQMVTRPIVRKYSPWFISRKVFIYGILSLIPYFLLVEPLNTNSEILSQTKVWANILGLSTIANVLCYALWNTVMLRMGAVKSALYIYLSPVATLLMAFAILNEPITPMAVIGLFIVIGGMIMAEKKECNG